MEARSLTFIAGTCGGTLLRGRPETLVQRVNTDSRSVQPGDLFVALSGERFDGHHFLAEAAAKGASALLVESSRLPVQLPGVAVIAVDSSRMALGQLGAAYRREFDLPVIGVGGSNGKTTTKDLIAAVLGRRFATLKSEASFNNDIGVPLTLLRLERRHQAAVLEAGTNHPGELAPLLRMIAPRYGVVTGIGREHLEFFGDLAGVADEEGAMAESIPSEGFLLVNGDSPEIGRVIRRAKCRVAKAGCSEGCDWRATDIRVSAQGTEFRASHSPSGRSGVYRVRMPGRHHAVNALFAIALGMELGLKQDEIESGLRECEPPAMRSRLEQVRGVWILNDAYNANADSMAAALRTLGELECAGRRIAVLGDMAELGPHTEAAHVEAGRVAAECGVDDLIAVGAFAGVTAEAARKAGLKTVVALESVELAGAAVKDLAKAGDVVLVKASRAAKLERIVKALNEA
jgi:UDP-N-acetylmuramoyl-tripeptide--D-alanyl-D-alanine ligase